MSDYVNNFFSAEKVFIVILLVSGYSLKYENSEKLLNSLCNSKTGMFEMARFSYRIL